MREFVLHEVATLKYYPKGKRRAEAVVADKILDEAPIVDDRDLTSGGAPREISMSDYERSMGGFFDAAWSGDTFTGSFGGTQDIILSYEDLRSRCSEVFLTNRYARALIRRIVSNVIASGMWPEHQPETGILGLEKGSLKEFSRRFEALFKLWSKAAEFASIDKLSTFGKIQADAYREALVGGDALVIWETDVDTNMPRLKVIPGSSVTDPNLDEFKRAKDRGNKIKTGVEVNSKGAHIAYFVLQEDRSIKRVLASDPDTGRIISRMVYVFDRRVNSTRGEPLLSILLTSLKELDRFLSATQRKAALNASIALVAKKTGPARQLNDSDFGGIEALDTPTYGIAGAETQATHVRRAKNEPGVIMANMPENVDVDVHSTAGTDINYPAFEDAIICVMAWLCELPPESLKLGYGSNYAASQTVNGEFNQFILKERAAFAPQICQPTLVESMFGMVAMGDTTAAELLAVYNDPTKWYIREAWTNTHWMGKIRPQSDMLKNAKGLHQYMSDRIMTKTQAASHVSEVPWEQMIEDIGKEKALEMQALQPVVDFLDQNKENGQAVLNMLYNGSNGVGDDIIEREELKEELQEVS